MNFEGFKLQLIERSDWDLCGCIRIYQVILTKKNLSLRHIAHEFMTYLHRNKWWKLGIVAHQDWTHITQWIDIWKYCQDIMDEHWTQDFNGPLRRGILYKHEVIDTSGYCKKLDAKNHDILAIVEAKNNHLYMISGGWIA